MKGPKKRLPASPLVVATVDNPLWKPHLGTHLDADKAINMKTQAIVNSQHDAVESLYARGYLNRSEKAAADIFRSLWETFAQSNVRAVDYERDKVSGALGKVHPVGASHAYARQRLQQARVELGRRGYELVVDICGRGQSLKEVVGITGNGKEGMRARQTASDNLRSHLGDLAKIWGLWAVGPKSKG